MGICSTAKVIISSNCHKRPCTIQPGNREWVTIIEAVGYRGISLPPLIFKGVEHLSPWYDEELKIDLS